MDSDKNLCCMVLPSVSIAFGLTCAYNRVLRADLVDQLIGADYVMLARSKGICERRILFGARACCAAFSRSDARRVESSGLPSSAVSC